MKQFSFTVWPYGEVVVSHPSGVPGDSYWISIAGYYYGKIIKRNGKWVSMLNPGAEKLLSRDDIQAIGDRIDEQYPD